MPGGSPCASPSPDDIVSWREAPPLPDHEYWVQARSVLVVRAGARDTP